MALGCPRLSAAAALLFFALIQIHPPAIVADPAALFRPGGGRMPMILPLVHSVANSSRVPRSDFHRRLQGSESRIANSRMRLYDDLLSNGYYTTRLWIGTPPQEFALIVDSGSTVTYVPCSTCEQCGNHQSKCNYVVRSQLGLGALTCGIWTPFPQNWDPKFRPDLSSTYQPRKCSPECSCDAEKNQCTYSRQYAEMSSSSGVLGEDLISFGNESELTPQRAVFGCENAETGDLYSQHADGIMGLGRGELSIMDQLVNKHVISDSFSLCYGGMNLGGGAMVLGEIHSPSDMVYSKSDPNRSPYYNINLKEMYVAGKRLPLNPKVFDQRHGTVLDSGTTYAYLPEAAFQAFKHAILNDLHGLEQISGPDPNYNDICFSGAGSDVSELSKSFPIVDLVFGNGPKLSLSPENYLFRHLKVDGAYCLGVFQNGRDPTTLLGGIVVRNTLVTYDRERQRIGFWKTNCSELWEKLHIADPSPEPTSKDRESFAGAEPASAPYGPSFLPAGKIGAITFVMSFEISPTDLKPHVAVLSGVLSQYLGVKPSQVHLWNMTSNGDGSFVKWAILPGGSSNYFTDATASHIMARLAENHFQFPTTFVKYKLVNWSVQPPDDKTWMQLHYLIVVMAVIFTVIIGLSVYGIWFVWKWRQETTVPYKPVDQVIIPEQELQPLN
ncbi:hypothetical protein V2J09_016386 [Rumex salicifolius]